MERFLERKYEQIEHEDEHKALREIGFYTALALFGVFLIGYAVNYVLLSVTQLGLTGINAVLYSALIAVAEEQFFRAFILDWLLSRIALPMVAVFFNAVLFMGYHFARYGTDLNALGYVLGGGLILGLVAYKSKRISPCMAAHVINNVVTLIR